MRKPYSTLCLVKVFFSLSSLITQNRFKNCIPPFAGDQREYLKFPASLLTVEKKMHLKISAIA